MEEEQLKRINKFIGETGYCSRREADQLIEEQRVTINDALATMGAKVSYDDEVRIDGKLIREKNEKMVYLAFNKPVGIECTTNLDVPENIVDFINYPKRIFPIGRLDKASEGLIFMTNDGDIVNKILRARNNHEKEYTVTVNRPITDRFIDKMGNGVPILDTVTRKCKVEQISKYNFKIILTQGLNRQIRRMCEYLGFEVTALKRIRIINISLDVPVGRYRDLTDAEINELNQLIAPSSKTEEASFIEEERDKRQVPREQRMQQSRNRSQETRAVRPDRNFNPSNKIVPRTIISKTTQQEGPTHPEAPTANQKLNFGIFKNGEPKPTEKRPNPLIRKVEFIKKDDPNYKKKGDY
jgi:23S rRNA pseudouridine2604 synthase